MKDKTHLIPEGWKEMTLGETVNIIDGDRGSNYPKNNELLSNGFCLFLSTKNVPNTSFCFDEVKFINEKVHSKLRKGKLEKNDFVLTTRGTIGNFAYFSENTPYDHIRINSGMVVLRAKKELLENGFLEFFLKSGFFRKQVYSFSSGTAQPQLPIKDLRYIKMLLPPLPEQKAIAEVLSSFDNKIELLREQNKTLEAIAQTIFNEWFVHFNFPDENGKPYQASGGKMIDSELGSIPEGWRVGSFGEFVQDIIPGDWGQQNINSEYSQKVICLRGTDLSDIKNGSNLRAPLRYLKKNKLIASKIKEGDLIIEISGGTIGQSTGRIAYYNQEIEKRLKNDAVSSNFCKVLRLNNPLIYPFIFFYWEYFYNIGLFFNYENGTTGIQNLNLKGFLEHKIFLPEERNLMCFSFLSNRIIVKIQKNNTQIQTLSNLCNELLPKLMKGEIRLKGVFL